MVALKSIPFSIITSIFLVWIHPPVPDIRGWSLSSCPPSNHWGWAWPLRDLSLVAQMVKNLLAVQKHGFDPWVKKIPWKREWLPTPVFLPGESHGQKSLVGYSQWGHKELDMTERLSTHLSLSIQRNVWFLFSFFKSKPLWAFNLKPIDNYLNITILIIT